MRQVQAISRRQIALLLHDAFVLRKGKASLTQFPRSRHFSIRPREVAQDDALGLIACVYLTLRTTVHNDAQFYWSWTECLTVVEKANLVCLRDSKIGACGNYQTPSLSWL